MRLDWERHFGFGTTSVSVTIGRLFILRFSTVILDIRHKVVCDRIKSAVNETTFEELYNALMVTKTQ